MANPTRVPGRYGRRAPSNRPALRLADIRTAAVVPPHPTTEDYLDALSDWKMLGNDTAGDCVAVTWANLRRLVSAFLTRVDNYPSQDEVWQVYRTQNPTFDPNGSADTNGPGSSADGGMDIQTLLEYLVKHGGPDGVKALAFAKVDYRNVAELEAALAIFGGVWTGIEVSAENQDEFSAGQPWDAVGTVEGGHSVLCGGYNPDVKFITWGAETAFTPSFVQRRVEEAWVVIWPEHLGTRQFEAGIDQAALAQAYQELTGQPFPVQPAPEPPAPAPVPAPSDVHMDSADEALMTQLGPWLNEHHVGVNRAAVHHVKDWINLKTSSGG